MMISFTETRIHYPQNRPDRPENEVIVELKSVENLSKAHEVQLANYLSILSAKGSLLSASFIRNLAEQKNNPKNPVNPVQ